MRVSEVMTSEPACCSTETTIKDAAKLMAENDCGCLPVVDAQDKVLGVVTDRDIACRCVAEGKDASTPVSGAMSAHPACCGADDDVEEANRIMSDAQVRRVPVVDASTCCVGMVSQADIARAQASDRVGEVVAGVSKPTPAASEAP
jgi:CBS domain-containing protein